MRTVGLGISNVKNPRKAGQEAARKALENLGSGTCQSCLVFSTVGYPQQVLLDAIKSETGPVPMVGCSAAGVIGPGIADESNHSVLVLTLDDDRVRLTTAGHGRITDSSAAASEIAKSFQSAVSSDVRFILLFPDGLHVVADELLSALEEKVGSSLPILGGSAGENWRWRTTYQYHDWEIYRGGVSAAMVSGDFRVTTVASHGCLPVGREIEVTKVERNRVYELDNRPALSVMADYVGDDVWNDFGKVKMHFSLGLQLDKLAAEEYDPLSIRFISKGHLEDKSISLPVRMNKGDRLLITRRDRQKMFQAAQQSIVRMNNDLAGNKPFLVLHFDCAGRGHVMLSEADKLGLIKSFQAGIAPDAPWAGFYAYGEFCPLGSHNHFHNYTAVIAALSSTE